MVQVEDTEGNWIEVSNHRQIVDTLISKYFKKYHQTEQTPPMRALLRPCLGYLGMRKNVP